MKNIEALITTGTLSVGIDKIQEIQINEMTSADDNPTPGSFTQRRLTARVRYPDAEAFKDKALTVKIDDNTMGTFKVNDVKQREAILTIEALDDTEVLNNKYFFKLPLPTTANTILRDIEGLTGLKITPTNDFTIDYNFDGQPYRDVISYIAARNGRYVTVNRQGIITLRDYKETDRVLKTNEYNTIEHGQSPSRITGLSSNGLKTGTDEYIMGFDTPLMDMGQLQSLLSRISQREWYSANVSAPGIPDIEAGDIITVVKRDGKQLKIMISELTFTYNGSLTMNIKSKATDPQKQAAILARPDLRNAVRAVEELLQDSWSIRVLKGPNDLISEINVSEEGVRIQGDKVTITGKTFIEEGIITSGMIRDLTADKLIAGTINADEVEIINLKIENLTGNFAQFSRMLFNGEYNKLDITGDNVKIMADSGYASTVFHNFGMEVFRNGITAGWFQTYEGGVGIIGETGNQVILGTRTGSGTSFEPGIVVEPDSVEVSHNLTVYGSINVLGEILQHGKPYITGESTGGGGTTDRLTAYGGKELVFDGRYLKTDDLTIEARSLFLTGNDVVIGGDSTRISGTVKVNPGEIIMGADRVWPYPHILEPKDYHGSGGAGVEVIETSSVSPKLVKVKFGSYTPERAGITIHDDFVEITGGLRFGSTGTPVKAFPQSDRLIVPNGSSSVMAPELVLTQRNGSSLMLASPNGAGFQFIDKMLTIQARREKETSGWTVGMYVSGENIRIAVPLRLTQGWEPDITVGTWTDDELNPYRINYRVAKTDARKDSYQMYWGLNNNLGFVFDRKNARVGVRIDWEVRWFNQLTERENYGA